jgi:HD-GYP domain-containing protein (c-di-GMP phosphodiesterase class II)
MPAEYPRRTVEEAEDGDAECAAAGAPRSRQSNPSMNEATSESVNAHYLDHVVATAQSHEVAATEDIVTGNGIKLLAKGARIDAKARDRLLEHKLSKPLEDCVEVVGGVIPARFEPIATALLDKHPLLRALCVSERAQPVSASLAALTLSPPMQSLLTVYSQYQQDRLDHTVGVALLALALARRVLPGEIDRHRQLATAGLVHDVGELYIDPAYLRKDTALAADQWRHIVTHPVVAHRVLQGMVGAGRGVADIVLLHHERLDGFGYPRRIEGDAFSVDGQILAVAEWLMAFIDAGLAPLTRARMAMRLVPGEFGAALLEAVSSAARQAPDAPVEISGATPLEDAVPRVARVADTLRRFREHGAWLDERVGRARPALKTVLLAATQRMSRIQASFSSAGLDTQQPAVLLSELAALRDPHVYIEITTLVSELEWRIRELEREQRLRASPLDADDQRVVEELIARINGSPQTPAAVA